jgi:hypothetical protein
MVWKPSLSKIKKRDQPPQHASGIPFDRIGGELICFDAHAYRQVGIRMGDC